MTTKAKKPKLTEGYCMTCRKKNSPIRKPKLVVSRKKDGNKSYALTGACGRKCGKKGTIYKFVAKDVAKKIIAKARKKAAGGTKKRRRRRSK